MISQYIIGAIVGIIIVIAVIFITYAHFRYK